MRFIILKTSALGDILQCFTAIRRLHSLFPQAEIDWVVEKSHLSLLDLLPVIKEKIPFDRREWRASIKRVRQKNYDIAFDLQGNCKSAALLAFTKAKEKVGFGRKSVAEWPNLLCTTHRYDPPKGKNIREDYLYLIERHFHAFETPKLHTQVVKAERILISIGSRWPNKKASLSTIIELLSLIYTYKKVEISFIWGNDEERVEVESIAKAFPQVHLLGKLPPLELHKKMQEMDLILSMDSFPLHLAEGKPTFALFGPSSAKKYAPGHFVQGSCPYGVEFNKRCPALRSCKTGACMKELQAEEIFVELKKLL